MFGLRSLLVDSNHRIGGPRSESVDADGRPAGRGGDVRPCRLPPVSGHSDQVTAVPCQPGGSGGGSGDAMIEVPSIIGVFHGRWPGTAVGLGTVLTGEATRGPAWSD